MNTVLQPVGRSLTLQAKTFVSSLHKNTAELIRGEGHVT